MRTGASPAIAYQSTADLAFQILLLGLFFEPSATITDHHDDGITLPDTIVDTLCASKFTSCTPRRTSFQRFSWTLGSARHV